MQHAETGLGFCAKLLPGEGSGGQKEAEAEDKEQSAAIFGHPANQGLQRSPTARGCGGARPQMQLIVAWDIHFRQWGCLS